MTRTSAPRTLPDIAGGSVPARFVQGARAALAGVGIVFSDGRLLALSAVPMAVHVVLLAGFVVEGFGLLQGPLSASIAGIAGGDSGVLRDVLAVIAHVVAAVLVLAASLVATVLTGSVVCDPFFDAISERTEELYLGHSVGAPLSVGNVLRSMARELSATFLRLAVYASVAVPLWLLSFTPLAIVATPLNLLWTWLFLSYEFLSRSLARHAVDMKKRFSPIFSNKSLSLGFGAVAWVASFLPFTAPLLIAGATRLYIALAACDRAPSKLGPEDRQRLDALIQKKA